MSVCACTFMRNSLVHLAALSTALALLAISSSAQLFSPLHTFSTASGFSAPLAQGQDGTLYGTSSLGGINGYGTVFKIQPDGTGFVILYSSTNGVDGSGPAAGLAVAGNTLYGTAKNGGSGG